MMPRWVNLNEQDRAVYRVTAAFLNSRLEERETVDWALTLTIKNSSMRLALLDVIDSPAAQAIAEPWQSAWRMIEESWNTQAVEDPATDVYHVQQRLQRGERSGALVTRIVALVAPRLEIEQFSPIRLDTRRPPMRPKKVEDLFKASLTSGGIVDPGLLGLESLTDSSFLASLAQELDAAVNKGLDIARRIGWCGEGNLWQLGELHRIYYVPIAARAADENEADEFHRGIAPSVKLLHAVITRLLDIDNSAAIEFVRRWKSTNSPIHTRLWAALATDPRVAPANEVAAWLTSLDDRVFWNLHDYPEISVLRAKRFGEMEPHEQAALAGRIRKRPPRNQWPKNADAERVNMERVYWAARELRRIEIAGSSLPSHEKTWLDAWIIRKFPELAQMARITDGFLVSTKARWGAPNPDRRYDLLAGEERLKALEGALSAAHRGWEDDPAERAGDWIRQRGNALQVLADFETVTDGGAAFAGVWERFGWAHAPKVEQGEEAAGRDLSSESTRVLSLLGKLPEATIRSSIDGISHWLSSWEKQVVALPAGQTVWLKLWPIAVAATNAKQPDEENVTLDTIVPSSDNHEPMELDTLNTPAGKLVGVFLAACPTVKPGDSPFSENTVQRQMRNAVEAFIGHSGLIVKYRLIQGLHYFLRADFNWTCVNLVPPLMEDNSEARVLWRAVASRTRFDNELKVIGEAMVGRATDPLLDRKTRSSLVVSLVIESLYAFHADRKPAVPNTRVEQMIRSLEDEVRADGAEAVQRFVRDVSTPRGGGQVLPSAEQLFRSAAAPFLQQVWPQERPLATPGVSRALAKLPATAGEAFAEAVDIIERFLVPFDCWSMIEYGLYGEEDGQRKLSSINEPVKAEAFLRLLDRTIGTAEGSVIPHDLAGALDQIRSVASNLAETQGFRRLATAARRG